MNRQIEINKYERCYKSPLYKLGNARRSHIEGALRTLPTGTLLDVGCGRGEVLDMSAQMGFVPTGVEAVEYLCDGVRVIHGMAHELPFDDESFDVVTMFDVMEHLIPEDTVTVCRELSRVARKTILLTIHNGPSSFKHGGVGEELHINRLPSYADWNELLQFVFRPHTVEWLPRNGSISEMFKVTKHGIW